jgi:glucosamine--fructose-6-phosphate aminotransferase (isomerizing)
MNTVESFESEIKLQLEFLDNPKLQKPLSPQQQTKTVFCGTGDSLASAMLAESFSNYRIRALDPLDLTKNKNLAHDKSVYFVSVSGNTISNIRAAKLVKNSIAITKNTASRLAKICGKTIPLNYQSLNVLAPGSISFLASTLACISLTRKLRIKNAKKLFLSAQNQAAKISLKNKIYFIGNQYTYPLTMYAAAKLYEVLGADAHYERIEQFSHMELFSTKKGDTVIIFENANRHNKQLTMQLRKLGLSVYQPTTSSNKISQILFYIFVSQMMALNHAKRKHLKECYFIAEKKIQNASSAMIY